MMDIPVHDKQGNVVETIQFDETCLGTHINMTLLHAAIVMYEANQRAGTVATRNVRALVGSTKKPYRQKGTGRARMGTKRRVGSRGGSTCHGPQPRDYSLSMPKKARRAAVRGALLGKFRDDEIILIDALSQAEPKTKEVAQVLRNLKADGGALVVVDKPDAALWMSVRNLPEVEMCVLKDLNTYSVLRRKRVVMTKAALDAIPQEMK